ncbi:hypothetical protein ACRTD0_23115, partial [Vibrio alginolyticus]
EAVSRVFGKNQHNKAFKSDSQRLAVSLRSSIAKRCSHLNAALAFRGKYEENNNWVSCNRNSLSTIFD